MSVITGKSLGTPYLQKGLVYYPVCASVTLSECDVNEISMLLSNVAKGQVLWIISALNCWHPRTFNDD